MFDDETMTMGWKVASTGGKKRIFLGREDEVVLKLRTEDRCRRVADWWDYGHGEEVSRYQRKNLISTCYNRF